MKITDENIRYEIMDLMAREKRELAEAKSVGGHNSYAAGYSTGYIEALKTLLDGEDE